MIAYRRNRNLNDLLVTRRLPQDTEIIPPIVSPNVDKSNNTCEECRRVFATSRGKMIHYTLMHLKNSNNSPPPKGFTKCGDKRCNTCSKGTFSETIHVTSTNKVFTIKQRITCKTSNVIYCLTCKKCKAQYIGETNNEIHTRQAGHLRDIREGNIGLSYVRHFLKCGIDNYTITGVEKVRSRDATIRKSREVFYKLLFKVQIV